MKSLLTKIFYHQLEEHQCDEKYEETNIKLCENDEYMLEALKNNSELLAHYKAVTDALDEYDAIAVKDFYELGFKSGFSLAIEVFDNLSGLK